MPGKKDHRERDVRLRSHVLLREREREREREKEKETMKREKEVDICRWE